MTLYTACRYDRASHRGTVVDITRSPGRSPFAPSVRLLADYKAGRCGWEEYEDRYTAEQRGHYRRDPESWRRLIEQATAGDVTLVCYERGEEDSVRCHRRLLREMLLAVAHKLGHPLDVATGGTRDEDDV